MGVLTKQKDELRSAHLLFLMHSIFSSKPLALFESFCIKNARYCRRLFVLCGETEIRTREAIARPQLSRLLYYHSTTSPKSLFKC